MYRLTFGEFLIVTALAAAASLAVFAHADRHGNKHATAWGIATFLAFFAAGAIPLIPYVLPMANRHSLGASVVLTFAALFLGDEFVRE